LEYEVWVSGEGRTPELLRHGHEEWWYIRK